MKQVIKEFLLELFPNQQQLKELQHNYEILRREVEKMGREYEQKTYYQLLDLFNHTVSLECMISDSAGIHTTTCQLYFSAESYHVKQDGTLCFCIDADGLPTKFGIKPSYHFYKCFDNSVYY